MVDALSHWWLITSIINTRNANEVIETRLINFKYLWRLFQSISYYSFKYWSRDLLIIWMNVHRKHNLKSDDSCAKWKVLSVTVSVPASYPARTRHWSKYREEQGCLLLSSVEHVALWAEATRVWSTVRLLSVRAHLLPWRGRCGVCEPCVHLSLLLYAALPPADPLTGLTQKWHLRLTELYHLHLQSIQFSSVTQSCPTLCDPMDCSAPGFPFHHQLLELAQTHVHRVCDAIQSSHSLSSRSPPAFNLSQHQAGSFPMSQFFTSGGQSIGVSASASVLPMNIQDWFPLGRTGWISLQSRGLSRVFNITSSTSQFKSINSSVLSFLYSPNLTSVHD